MTVSSVNMLAGILWGSTHISQITSSRTMAGVQTIVTGGAGAPQPIFAGNMKQQPDVTLDTTQVASILTLAGSSIVEVSNADLFYRQAATSGERTAAATAAHIRLRMAKACMMPQRLTARDGAEASMSVAIYPRYDGSTEPIVAAGSTALSITPGSAEHYTCGPIAIAGTAVDGVQEINIDFGINLLRLGSDGQLYDTFFTVGEFRPVITVKVLKDMWTSSVGLNGLVDDCVVYLRKVGSTGRVANNATTNISFTVASSYMTIDDTAGGMNDPAMTTISIRPVSSDGITAPIAIDTTADIA